MITPISVFYAGVLTFCYLYLSALVIYQRRKLRISLGDGGDKHFQQLIRAHGNFSEYVPLTLLLMLMTEMNLHYNLLLHICGITLIFGRLLHAYGLRNHVGASWQRVWGEGMTFAVMIVLAGLNIFSLYTAQFRILPGS